MNVTIERLAELCRREPLREKLLFVPSHSIGHQIRESLARTGNPWINLRIATPFSHANELIASDLYAQGIRLIEEYERTAIIEDIYKKGSAGSKKGIYFSAAVEIPGIVRCLSVSLHEMRMAGLESRKLNSDAFIVKTKGEEIIWLLSEYENYLSGQHLTDRAGVLKRAIECLRVQDKKEQNRVVLALSDCPFAFLEKELVKCAGGKDLIAVPHGSPIGAVLPKRFISPEPTPSSALPPVSVDVDLFRWLSVPEEAPPPLADGSVSMLHALGESNEVREIFRRILSKGISFDDVEILISDLDPYVSLFYEIGESIDIPCTFASGIPVTYTRPGRGLMLYCRWLTEDFASKHLRQLLSGNYLELSGSASGKERLPGGLAGFFIREAAIGWGRERYEKMLKSLREHYLTRGMEAKDEGDEEGGKWFEELARKVESLTILVNEILGAIPAVADDGMVNPADLSSAVLNFLRELCRVAGKMDAQAKLTLTDVLESLTRIESQAMPIADAVSALLQIIKETTVGHSGPRPGCAHVAHYRSGGYSGRTSIFLAGFEQNRFPGSLNQDPILLDEERERVSPHLVTARELLHEKSYALGKLLMSLRGNVTFSYSCRDLGDDKELFPSSALLNVFRLSSGNRDADYTALIQSLGKPAGFIPERGQGVLNGWEWWLAQHDTHYGDSSVYSCFPHIMNGKTAESMRSSDQLTVYDGFLPSSLGFLDPYDARAVFSASRLESMARCPFAYMMRYVLGVEALEEMEKDPGKWLDALQRGELLHEIFRQFMETVKDKGERPSLALHSRLLEDIAMREVEKWKQLIPPPGDLAFTREVEDIRQTLRIFLREEEERCKVVEPLSFELSFGIDSDPVEIAINKKKAFRLRGRIDRVDKVGSHEYEVWDYKTGSTWGYSDDGFLKRGTQIQHALYTIAAEYLIRKETDAEGRVVRAGYFFPGPKGEGARVERDEISREQVYSLLGDLFGLISAGVFPSSCNDEPCRYCDYQIVCGNPAIAVERSARKSENDGRLSPMLRLQEYE